jgi:hypothetical protein
MNLSNIKKEIEKYLEAMSKAEDAKYSNVTQARLRAMEEKIYKKYSLTFEFVKTIDRNKKIYEVGKRIWKSSFTPQEYEEIMGRPYKGKTKNGVIGHFQYNGPLNKGDAFYKTEKLSKPLFEVELPNEINGSTVKDDIVGDYFN